jgi:hypothetical protein
MKNEIWWGCILRASNFSIKIAKKCASLRKSHANFMADNKKIANKWDLKKFFNTLLI